MYIQKKVDMGVIGCGDVALIQYLPIFKNSEKLNLVALCDKDEKRLKKVAKLFKIDNIFTSHEEMLRSGLVKAVANLTPPLYHYPISLDCLNAKVHTFSEKPIAFKISEFESLIKSSRDNMVKFACAPATPVNPILIKAKQLLDKRAIGKPCYAVGTLQHAGPASQNYNINYYKNLVKQQQLYGFEEMSTDPTWFYKKGGGALEDAGVYTLTSLVFLLGSVKYMQCLIDTKIPEVEVLGGIACGKKIKVEVNDCALQLLEFEEGPYASVNSSWCAKGTRMPDIEIYGSEGTISISGFYTKLEVYLEHDNGLAAWNDPYEDLSGWRMGIGIEHLAECILENKEPVISGKLAKHVTEMLLKASQASSSGKKVLIESKV